MPAPEHTYPKEYHIEGRSSSPYPPFPVIMRVEGVRSLYSMIRHPGSFPETVNFKGGAIENPSITVSGLFAINKSVEGANSCNLALRAVSQKVEFFEFDRVLTVDMLKDANLGDKTYLAKDELKMGGKNGQFSLHARRHPQAYEIKLSIDLTAGIGPFSFAEMVVTTTDLMQYLVGEKIKSYRAVNKHASTDPKVYDIRLRMPGNVFRPPHRYHASSPDAS